ncbi:hypothetical protein DPMN_093936 [Dreissena polymorpha]|uniref:Uncharacterized protein n=1 Tax=Dreissena polymorpha TaxID=45954 RepID=A0A9D4L517_DREPO|nr:hypothetical protein DPMN_093936 [Dreissena polymorpha]
MRSMAADVERLCKLREADRREIEKNRAMQMRIMGMIETLLKKSRTLSDCSATNHNVNHRV